MHRDDPRRKYGSPVQGNANLKRRTARRARSTCAPVAVAGRLARWTFCSNSPTVWEMQLS